MVVHHSPPGGPHGAHSVVAGQADGGIGQASGQDLPGPEAQRPDQCVIAVDVAVQRRLSDTQFGCYPGERQRVEALGVDEFRRALDHPSGVKSLSGHFITVALDILTFKLWLIRFL